MKRTQLKDDENQVVPETPYQFAGSSFARRQHCSDVDDGGDSVVAVDETAAAVSLYSNNLNIRNEAYLNTWSYFFCFYDGLFQLSLF